jgi:RNA polymerase sigma factor (sigma-70 family)
LFAVNARRRDYEGKPENNPMRLAAEELIPTRATLLARLKDWQDHASWQEFFDTYWKLIYGVSRKSGLTETEAQDVVQEVLSVVSKQMPTFEYDPSGSFKAWLLTITRWRIADQVRKRERLASGLPQGNQTEVRTIEEVADPKIRPLEELWEEEWQAGVAERAMRKVREQVEPVKFQIFDCYARQGWPPEKVATAFGISVDQVYLTKHRVLELVRKEVERLAREGD